MNANDRQQQLVAKFQALPDWEARYSEIIKMGKNLSPMDDSLKVEDNVVKGCQSQVWLHASLNSEKQVEYTGDSDAMIVRGLVAVLLHVYSGATPQEILETPPSFIKELGFEGNLSPSRANGLFSMVKQIQFYATAFAAMLARA